MIVYRASEIGACTKYLVSRRLGYDPAPGYGEDIPAFKQGHIIEGQVLDYLVAHGWYIKDTQREYYLPIGTTPGGEEIVVQCHLDAVGSQMGMPDQYAIEIKSTSQDGYRAWREKRWEAGDLWLRYLYQVSCYHHASGLPVAFIVRSKPKTSQDTPQTEISMYASCPPLLTLQQIKDRVLDIESRADRYAIPDDCDMPNVLCPLAYLHENKTEFEDAPDIEKLAREYQEAVQADNDAKKSLWTLTNRRMTLRRKLLEALGRDPDGELGQSRTVDTGRVKVIASWGPVSRPRVDWEELKKVLPEEEKERLMKTAKYGYRVRVYVRD